MQVVTIVCFKIRSIDILFIFQALWHRQVGIIKKTIAHILIVNTTNVKILGHLFLVVSEIIKDADPKLFL